MTTQTNVKTTEEPLEWKQQISLFHNNPVTRAILLVLGIPFGLLLLWMTKLWLIDGQSDGYYAFCFIGFFLVITAIVVLAVYGGSYDVEYRLDGQGVVSANQKKQSRRLERLYRFGLILALFTRRPGAMGTFFLAKSSLKTFIAWKEARSVKYRPQDRLIIVKAAWAVKIYLFCTKENYEIVRARVEDHIKLNNSVSIIKGGK